MRCYSNAQGSFIYDVHRYARIEPQVLQVEIHPYLTQEPLIKYCKLLGLAITAYSSFGPQSYVELGGDKNAVSLLQHDVVANIASKTGKSQSGLILYSYLSPYEFICCVAATAQILLRWALQQGLAVIPKSNSHERLVQNLASTSFELTDEDLKTISALNINLRVCTFPIILYIRALKIDYLQLNDPVDLDPRLAIFA